MNNEDLAFLNKQTQSNFTETKICVYPKTVGTNAEVLHEIKNFSPIDGWVSLQSTPAKRISGTDFEETDEHILAGEFFNTSGNSLSVRFDGKNWNLFTYKESDEGVSVLKKSVKLLSKLGNDTYLNYNVFYKFDNELGYRPYCSAFTGFSEEKK
jgi:hypothetical protein